MAPVAGLRLDSSNRLADRERMASPLRSWWPIAALLAVFAAMLALGGPGSAVDRALLYRAQIDPIVPAARLVTQLGDWWFLLVAGGFAAAGLAIHGQWRRAALLVVLLLSERSLVEASKFLFDRVRPDPAGHLVAVQSMAFPSGHAANAMTLGLGLALLVPRRARRAAVVAALLYAVLVGLSRPILGVHWPSDVVGGWALGAAWTLLLVRLLGGTSARERH